MASIQQHNLQSRANQMLDSWLAKSTNAQSKTVDKREAQALLTQAKSLSTGDVETLKKAFLDKVKSDAFVVTRDASALFAEFFKIPADSIPLSSTKRTAVNNAQQTRVANESDKSVKVATKELKEIMRNMEGLPPNVQAQVSQSVMGLMQQGLLKTDNPDGRKLLTKMVAGAPQNGAGTLTDTMSQAGQLVATAARQNLRNAGREMLSSVVNVLEDNGGLSALDRALSMGVQPTSYADYVRMHGGSFEDILFAFLMQLADRADKKLEQKIQEMDKRERAQKAGQNPLAAMNKILADDTPDPETGRGGAVPPGPDGKVQKISTTLEAVVQSAHYATAANSAGGVQITAEEAGRLVDKLGRLPPNVQALLAGSISTAIKAKGLPLQQKAFDALVAWGNQATGGKFNVGKYDPQVIAKEGHKPDGELARALAGSDKLEDKIAGYLVDTLVDPGKDLKSKFEPFKKMRADIDALGTPAGEAAAQGAPAKAEGNKKGQKAKPVDEAKAAIAAPGAENADALAQPAPTEAEAEHGDTMNQHELQRLIDERKKIFEMLSDIMKSMADMIMTSVRNMRG